MELILINDNKLKVTLSFEDMRTFDIDCETLDYDNTETRRVFWNILDEAKHRTGFDAAADRVFIQVYPSQDGGCEMYVTKLSSNYPEEKQSLTIRNRAKSKSKREKEKIKIRQSIFRFSGIEPLLGLCSRISSMPICVSSSVYAENDSHTYFLELNLPDDYDIKNEIRAVIGEYNGQKCSDMTHFYLCEHCSCICEKNAVRTFAEFR